MIGPRLTEAKALAKDAFIDQGRELGERRRSDTSVFPRCKRCRPGVGGCPSEASSAPPREICKYSGYGGSMVARLKLKGIDGRAPQLAWSLRLNWIQRRETYQALTRSGLAGYGSSVIARVVVHGRS